MFELGGLDDEDFERADVIHAGRDDDDDDGAGVRTAAGCGARDARPETCAEETAEGEKAVEAQPCESEPGQPAAASAAERTAHHAEAARQHDVTAATRRRRSADDVISVGRRHVSAAVHVRATDAGAVRSAGARRARAAGRRCRAAGARRSPDGAARGLAAGGGSGRAPGAAHRVRVRAAAGRVAREREGRRGGRRASRGASGAGEPAGAADGRRAARRVPATPPADRRTQAQPRPSPAAERRRRGGPQRRGSHLPHDRDLDGHGPGGDGTAAAGPCAAARLRLVDRGTQVVAAGRDVDAERGGASESQSESGDRRAHTQHPRGAEAAQRRTRRRRSRLFQHIITTIIVIIVIVIGSSGRAHIHLQYVDCRRQ